ncbi:MAG: hypothetical protein ACRYFV_20675 [Janthinobacterium lividum]
MATTPISLYCSGTLYTGGQSVISDLQASGFNTVVAWALHVAANGDLYFNDTPIVQAGKYTGDAAWPNLLAGLKQGTTSVTSLGFSVGGWGVGDFDNIRDLIAQHGTGSSSPLYQSFQALTQAIPAIDFIDLDDETTYDQASTVAFCQMLSSAFNLHITFCPYTSTSYWMDCFQALNTQTPGLVLGLNLQCYAGGGGNDPETWIQALNQEMGSGFDGASLVWPGLWCINGTGCDQGTAPAAMQTQFQQWHQSDSVVGGFVWLYDDIQHCQPSSGYTTADYAQALSKGLA